MSSVEAPGVKTPLTPDSRSFLGVFLGNDPAAKNRDVAGAALFQEPHHFREQRHVRARQDAQPDRVDVFLHRGLSDHLGRLMQSRVDHLEAPVAQCARDYLGATVMPVESGLRDQNSELFSATLDRTRVSVDAELGT